LIGFHFTRKKIIPPLMIISHRHTKGQSPKKNGCFHIAGGSLDGGGSSLNGSSQSMSRTILISSSSKVPAIKIDYLLPFARTSIRCVDFISIQQRRRDDRPEVCVKKELVDDDEEDAILSVERERQEEMVQPWFRRSEFQDCTILNFTSLESRFIAVCVLSVWRLFWLYL
jgi:hypothetical protein